MQTAAVIVNSQSIKNSLQQMKHDCAKRNSSIKSTAGPRRETSTSLEQTPDAATDDDISEVTGMHQVNEANEIREVNELQ